MNTPREQRLLKEFEGMKALRSPSNLFQFLCSDLSPTVAIEFLRSQATFESLKKDQMWLDPDDFEQYYPEMSPEKYLIGYECDGVETLLEDGTPVKRSWHVMEVIFGWRFPSKPPIFIWHTPIWHPNFRQPYICLEGHRYAIGLMLSRVVVEVGRMIQYQSYNVKSPLNGMAGKWASENERLFPVDPRDILDAHKIIGAKPKVTEKEGEEVETLLLKGIEKDIEKSQPRPLIEVIEMNVHKI